MPRRKSYSRTDEAGDRASRGRTAHCAAAPGRVMGRRARDHATEPPPGNGATTGPAPNGDSALIRVGPASGTPALPHWTEIERPTPVAPLVDDAGVNGSAPSALPVAIPAEPAPAETAPGQ